MAKELICPECFTEYWGQFKDAQCGECEHKFTESEKIFRVPVEKYIQERKVNRGK